jgi:hypothetical protein
VKKFFVLFLAAFLFVSMVSISHARVLVKDSSVVKVNEDINMGQDLIFKDLVTIKGNINVKGDVGGDVVAVLGSVHLYPKARVAGDVVSVGGSVIKDEGAKIKGNITEIAIGKEGVNNMPACMPFVGVAGLAGCLFFKVLMVIGFIGLAMLTVAFFTKEIGNISACVEKSWLRSFLWGILGMILILPVAFVLVISIVGIPLILVEMVLISVAMTMGSIAVSQLIGKKVTKALRKPNQPMIIEVVWGLIILFLIDLVPFIGGLIKCLLIMAGFGGAIITQLGQK